MPKAELHVHLEGTPAQEVSFGLAKKHGIDLGVASVADLKRLYHFRNFRHFLHLYGKLTFLLAEPADFEDAASHTVLLSASQGGLYAEVTLTLGTHVHFKQMDPDAIVGAAWEGARRSEEEHGVTIRFILDHVRILVSTGVRRRSVGAETTVNRE
ncbi:MAG TPA: hypothetical protein VK988_10130 [Acidimicrobiales bacterium]|nr:hypothetical protein [Acidimicrobiales bacterium]